MFMFITTVPVQTRAQSWQVDTIKPDYNADQLQQLTGGSSYGTPQMFHWMFKVVDRIESRIISVNVTCCRVRCAHMIMKYL